MEQLGRRLWNRLTGTTTSTKPARRLDLPAKENERYLEAEPWLIEKVSFEKDPDRLVIGGRAFPPHGDPGAVKFFLNDREFDNVEYPIAQPALEPIFWNRENAALSGFECSTRLSEPERRGEVFLDVRFEYQGDAARSQPGKFASVSGAAYRDPAVGPPVPEAERRFRVIGTNSVEMFALGGATDFRKIEALLAEELGKSYRDFTRVLDWGCGCGRVARYFGDLEGIEFSGGDIDPDNIAWCAEKLEFGSFHHLPLVPPTEFADETFDLVYGVSVFTHLHEDVQFKWLEELKRITRPGGVVLVTVHGVTALNYAGLNQEAYTTVFDEVQEKGFLMTSGNDQIDEVIEDKEYYINAMHAKWYIREKWSKYFRIVDIVPGCIYTHDMIVMVNE